MKNWIIFMVVLLTLSACTAESPKKESKAYTTLESVVVTEAITFNTGNVLFRYYSYSKNQKVTTTRFHYDCDSSRLIRESTRDTHKTKSGEFVRLSFHTDASGDTLYLKNFGIERGSMGEKLHIKSRLCDSLCIPLTESSLMVYCYTSLSNDLPRDEEYFFFSPKHGYLFEYWPRMESTRAIIRHPKLSKKDLVKVKAACEEKLLQMKVRKQTAHD